KLSPELRELLGDAKEAARPTRMEVVLAYTPRFVERSEGAARCVPGGKLVLVDTPRLVDKDWPVPLLLPNVIIEGRLGPVATVRAAPEPRATRLAALHEVAAVRLPRLAQITPLTAMGPVGGWEPLKESGVARLHALKRRGKGTRLALVASDFRGWEKL